MLLSHGDLLCTDDVEYQALRNTMRDPAWQRDTLSKSLAERQAFGANLRAESKSNNANKPTNIMDVNDEATKALMADHKANVLIHGHTHRPGYHSQRIVTGAWERCAWVCRQSDLGLRLECFSLAQAYMG